jgi:hypothetical protein
LSVPYGDIRTDNGRGALTPLAHFYYEQGVEQFGAPASAWRGLIFRDNDRLILDFYDAAAGGDRFRFITLAVSEFKQYVFRGRDADPPYERVVQLPYPGPTTLRQHGPYTAGQRRDVVQQFSEAGIRQAFERSYPNPNPRVIAADEYRRTIDRMVEREIDRRVEDWPNRDFSLFELRIGEHTILIHDASGDPFTLPETVYLVPIVTVRLIQLGGGAEGAGSAGAGGAGAGGGAGGAGSGGDYESSDAGGAGQAGLISGGGAAGDTLTFPIVGGESLELEVGAFEGEPPLSALGADAEPIREKMRQIHGLLQAPEAEYAGRFILNAAIILGGRAAAVGIYAGKEAGFTAAAHADTRGNLGYLTFHPTASPAIQYLQHLSSTVPDLKMYVDLMIATYHRPEHAAKFGGRYRNNVVSWMVRFHIAMNSNMEVSVGELFVRTCQVLLLQLLRSSHAAIMGRLKNFSEYARVFEQVLLPELRSIQDLIDLRDRLRNNQRFVDLSATLRRVPHTGTAVTDWAEASRMLLDALVASNTAAARDTGRRGEIVVDDGVVKIFDEKGWLWTLEGLEHAIQYKRGFIESGDPLIKQLADLEGALDRFSGSSGHIQLHLLFLLVDMKQNNEAQQAETGSDSMHAFEMGQLTESIAEATIPYTTLPLQGIHMLAHEAIGEFFRGDRWYGLGVQRIANVVLAKRGLRSFFEFSIVLGLSVLCPPVGAGFGALLALNQYAEAREKEQLYESLIDPELVISRAEVEAELFAARLGLALAFIPEAGGIAARGLGVGVRAGMRAGVRSGTRVAGEVVEEAAEQSLRAGSRGLGRAIVGRLSREAAESLKHGLAMAFAREIVTDQVMDTLISKLMIEPIMQQIYDEYATIGPGLAGPRASGADVPIVGADGSETVIAADGTITVTYPRQAGGASEPAEGEE